MPIAPHVRASSVVNLCCTSARMAAILMLAGDLEPLFFIVAAEGGFAGFRVFPFFFLKAFVARYRAS